jgi:XTP/dITP diphosphohydrolase
MKGKVAFFVTTNIHKFEEARLVFSKHKVTTAMLKIEALEIQHNNLEIIAKASAIDAVEKCGLPMIVEDAGLFIKCLNGFPGPYSSYIHRTIGCQGILKLMEDVHERDAYFLSVVAFHGPEQKSPTFFHGKVEGEISCEEKGTREFGFDPIFEPYKPETGKSGSKTFGEMNLDEKNQYSHRAKALKKFVGWYKEGFK